MKISRSALAILMLLLPVASMAQDLDSPTLRISWDDFKRAHDAKRVVVVDVRGRDAWEAGRIPGAISVPLDDIEKRLPQLRKLGKPLVLYCA